MDASKVYLEFGTSVPDERFPKTGLGLCGLCANSGRIDTRQSARFNSAPCGVLAYCICPNGRQAKKMGRAAIAKWGGTSVLG